MIFIEEIEQDLYDKFIDSSIPSKFDKWIGYDFGDAPSYLINGNSLEYKGETWNFTGRQKDGRYAFVRTYPLPQEVLFTKTFNEVAKYLALPGRRYE